MNVTAQYRAHHKQRPALAEIRADLRARPLRPGEVREYPHPSGKGTIRIAKSDAPPRVPYVPMMNPAAFDETAPKVAK
jgi:hypothetical protein